MFTGPRLVPGIFNSLRACESVALNLSSSFTTVLAQCARSKWAHRLLYPFMVSIVRVLNIPQAPQGYLFPAGPKLFVSINIIVELLW